ncbi:VOC family protein [Brevibacillus formosus]|uniref:VOC family protein n=1 Tax=Brevibacillus formosus TaxID=54913 RepID=UPI003F1AA8E0
MITHFSKLTLQTVSIQGVQQVYADRLGFPISSQSDKQITFQITPDFRLTFEEVYEPISPAHIAFQVPYSLFHESAKKIKESGLLIVRWEDGHDIDQEKGRMNLYFRDGDGNLLEIIAHEYVSEEVVLPSTPLHILYLREVGCPVESVPVFTQWLKSNIGMKTYEDGDIFNFVIGGTAHIVATWKNRPWIPIAMKALPPKMHVTFGTPDQAFLQKVRRRFEKSNVLFHSDAHELTFVREGYSFSVIHTPDYAPDIPCKLQLPLSIST